MERIRALDTIRGACMWIMIYGHMIEWWLRPEDYWLRQWLFAFLESIGATGFLFISGASAALAFRSNEIKLQALNDFNKFLVRDVYFLRAIIILLIGFIYNFFVAVLWGGDITDLWSWLVLQTIGFSLILTWPFMRTAKTFRLFFGILIFVLNYVILGILLPYQEQPNFGGIMFHVLYNPLTQYPILMYFSVFLIGTVVGEIISDINTVEDQNERKLLFKKKFIIPTSIFGTILLVFGIINFFPDFLFFNTISAFAYSLGIILIVLSFFTAIQIFELIKTKKSYRYLFFYSYYSFTVYLGHNVLYFLFVDQLTVVTIWFAIIGGSILFGFLFRAMYQKLGAKASLKTGIGALSFIIATKFSKKKNPSHTK
ncbi:MAG: heparan-alpha-glucosaminide N-acetyltransferase domain-containing protein [Candidatus Odinarchaeota archaeon]